MLCRLVLDKVDSESSNSTDGDSTESSNSDLGEGTSGGPAKRPKFGN
jgi:hypothetical protein